VNLQPHANCAARQIAFKASETGMEAMTEAHQLDLAYKLHFGDGGRDVVRWDSVRADRGAIPCYWRMSSLLCVHKFSVMKLGNLHHLANEILRNRCISGVG
jgi:hypothetical protein